MDQKNCRRKLKIAVSGRLTLAVLTNECWLASSANSEPHFDDAVQEALRRPVRAYAALGFLVDEPWALVDDMCKLHRFDTPESESRSCQRFPVSEVSKSSTISWRSDRGGKQVGCHPLPSHCLHLKPSMSCSDFSKVGLARMPIKSARLFGTVRCCRDDSEAPLKPHSVARQICRGNLSG